MTAQKKHIFKAHDHFFRKTMADKRVSREFFEVHLPEELRNIIDLNQLEIESGTFIDDLRQESIADMLFKTRIERNDAYLYLIVDHQSRPDPLMPFRILKYICNIIDQHLKDTASHFIPLVVPIVVYHGKSPWNYSTYINDLVDAPKNFVDNYFLKPFILIDLTKIEDAILKKKAWLGVMELTLKHIFARDILPHLHDIIELLQILEKSNGENITETVLTYIIDRGEITNKDTFIALVKQGLSSEIGEKIVTIAEQFKAEGVKQGVQQGVQQSLEKVAKKILSEETGFTGPNLIAFVQRITGLSKEKIEELGKKTLILN